MKDELLVRRGTGLLEAEVGGELVGLNVEQGTCYGFNATATRVWALIEEPKLFSDLRDTLMGEYEVDEDTCGRELMDLLKDLEKDGLVILEPAQG